MSAWGLPHPTREPGFVLPPLGIKRGQAMANPKASVWGPLTARCLGLGSGLRHCLSIARGNCVRGGGGSGGGVRQELPRRRLCDGSRGIKNMARSNPEQARHLTAIDVRVAHLTHITVSTPAPRSHEGQEMPRPPTCSDTGDNDRRRQQQGENGASHGAFLLCSWGLNFGNWLVNIFDLIRPIYPISLTRSEHGFMQLRHGEMVLFGTCKQLTGGRPPRGLRSSSPHSWAAPCAASARSGIYNRAVLKQRELDARGARISSFVPPVSWSPSNLLSLSPSIHTWALARDGAALQHGNAAFGDVEIMSGLRSGWGVPASPVHVQTFGAPGSDALQEQAQRHGFTPHARHELSMLQPRSRPGIRLIVRPCSRPWFAREAGGLQPRPSLTVALARLRPFPPRPGTALSSLNTRPTHQTMPAL